MINAGTPQRLQLAFEHYQNGGLPEAAGLLQQILQLEPDHLDALNLLGVIFHQQGQLEQAESRYRRLIFLKPDYADVYSNLGVLLQQLGKLDDAAASFRQALQLKPDYAEAHNNLGNILREQGHLDEAAASFRQALLLKPDYAGVHNNLGNVLETQGAVDQAVTSYRQAIGLQPDHADAHYNLGNALYALGRTEEAAGSLLTALQLNENSDIKYALAQCMGNMHFTQATPQIRSLVVRAISEVWSRPGDLLTAAKSLIMLNPGVKQCIDRATAAWPVRLSGQELFGAAGLAFAADEPLLLCLLENTPINDMGFECFLTMARKILLESAIAGDTADNPVADQTLAFYCAIARQCLINEYIYAYTEQESGQAEWLRDRLAACIETGSPVTAMQVITVAAYFPLFSVPSIATLMRNPMPDALTALLTPLLIQQVLEPTIEHDYRATMPRLTEIDDGVSLMVQQQYEENPYPRWVNVPSGGRITSIDGYFHQNFPKSSFQPLCKNDERMTDEVDILIAGCGTGQHSIQAAQQFRGARVLAIDLSLTSLCYAKRKTDELGLHNLDYAQADIMKLGTINRSFDVIQAGGVLHHLADPVAGWQVLLKLLRPGGFMHLGFYSEIARQHVATAQNFIVQQGYAADAKGIRQFRQDIMAEGKNGRFMQMFATATDFYTMSACRDLLFHVQEHRYRVLQLKQIMESLRVNFIGFNLEPAIEAQYVARFPDDAAKTDLNNWDILETEIPTIFASMYQFWVQKPG